jgi:predicted ArsR family transcriptional regulator
MSSANHGNDGKPWRFVTNHTQVLLCIARERGVRLRDVAETVGITERAAQRIVTDLVEAGFVTRKRVGRRNHYTIDRTVQMRHPSQADHLIGELLDLLELESPKEDAGAPTGGQALRPPAPTRE